MTLTQNQKLTIIAAVSLAMLGSMHEVWRGILTLWLTTDTYMHGLFVPALVVMMFRQMPAPKHHKTPSIYFSEIILFGWALCAVISSYLLVNTLSQAVAIAAVPAILIAIRGAEWAWHYRAPLLLWMMALPFGDFLIPHLQSFTADMSVMMLQWSGVSVVRNGWYIRIPAADFRVAEACSGVNFLISTFTLSVFYSFMYFRRKIKRIGFIALGAIVPILANGVRVYMIIMIAHAGDVEAATGFDHLVYGWIFFFIIIAVLLWIGSIMQRNETETKKPYDHKTQLATVQLPMRTAHAIAFYSAVVFAFSYTPVEPTSSQPTAMVTAAASIYPTADKACVDPISPTLQHAVFSYQEESVKSKLVSYENRVFDEKMWGLSGTRMSKVHIDDTEQPVKVYEIVDLNGKRITVYQSFRVAGYWHADMFLLKWSQMIGKMSGSDKGGEVHLWFVLESPEKQPLYFSSECSSTDQLKGI